MKTLFRLSVVLLVALPTLSGCATLQEIASLRDVKFAIDNVSQVQLAGVNLDRVRSYDDLSVLDALRLTRAVTNRELPLDFVLHLSAENPPDNSVQARMVQLDWTLFLQDRETISGVFNDNVVLPPGQPQDVPITISLDLIRFFDDNARDLVELALALGGQDGGAPKQIRLQATPSIDTPIGPIRYPEPITIVSREVGGS